MDILVNVGGARDTRRNDELRDWSPSLELGGEGAGHREMWWEGLEKEALPLSSVPMEKPSPDSVLPRDLPPEPQPPGL